jgi:hypothetical protein
LLRATITGETNDILAFTCAYADNGANYKVVVTNLYGSATSAPAALTVMTDLLLVSSPASITRHVCSKAAFIAVPGGVLPVTYQWYKGTTQIPGATDQTLWLSNLKSADDQTTCYAHITNPWANTNSDPATLTVAPRVVTVPITGYAKVIMADDPVPYWRLDEPDGSATAVDAAGSFDGTYTPGTGSITYLNGNLSATQAYDAFIPNGDGWASLGFRFDGGSGGFDGAIDDVAFYNKALTLKQIQAHYNATVELGIKRSGNNVILSWPLGTLQSAPVVTGAYTNMPSATSPFANAVSQTPQFYRVKVQ